MHQIERQSKAASANQLLNNPRPIAQHSCGDRLSKLLHGDVVLLRVILDLASKCRQSQYTEILKRLSKEIAMIDRRIEATLNLILHTPRFQQLEASWRGLRFLIDRVESNIRIRIRLLNVSWKELTRDLDRATEFDSSQFFEKVYSQEFGTAGGIPFGVLVGDYYIRPRPSQDHPLDDVATLTLISNAASAAFAPFICSAHPSLFSIDSFTELERSLDLAKTFEQPDFVKWCRFRETDDSRFVGITVPRILMRQPYGFHNRHFADLLQFEEDISAEDRTQYLWGNSAYAFASVLIRSFNESNWLAGIRGVRRDVNVSGVAEGILETGGIVTGLPKHVFETDTADVGANPSTDVIITDQLESELSRFGFISLAQCKETPFTAFYSLPSAHQPENFQSTVATANERFSAMLNYTFCISRFAHYIKVIFRDLTGTFAQASDLEKLLISWLNQYVTQDSDASADVKAKYPLREAAIQIREKPGTPGSFLSSIYLWPHYGLDELGGALRVRSELSGRGK